MIALAVKYSGCTFAGLIGTSDAGQEATGKLIAGTQLTLFNDYVDLISRSNCTYIGRAVDTWDWAPDFTAIASNITAFNERVTGTHILGEYVAEKVPLNGPTYYSTILGRDYIFANMCKTPPVTGDTDCKDSYNQPEYVTYVTDIMTQSINLGIQVFLFGEVGNTDSNGTLASSQLVQVMNSMRTYAASKGQQVLYVAQFPSTYGGSSYLNSFDLIQGAVYMNANGTIPNTPTVTNKDGPAPPRLWLATNASGKPVYNPQKLVIEYDWFSNPIDDSSEMGCLSTNSQAYFDYLRSLSTANCPLGTMVGSAVPVTTAIYNNLKSLGVGFWRPGRQRVAYRPFIYTPMNLTLAPGTPEETNFNDEGVLVIGAAQ